MENPREDEGRRQKMESGDLISGLPEETLHQILSHLPSMEAVARTSLLSRRWRGIWSTYPALHVSSTAAFLLRCDSLPLQTREERVRFAADRKVEQLILLGSSGGGSVEIPASLRDCRSLRVLKIQNCVFPEESFCSLPLKNYKYLTTLSFHGVEIAGFDFSSLRWASPCIQTLSLSRCSKLKNIIIQSATIRDLVVHECDDLALFGISIAYALRRLVFCGNLCRLWSIQTVPKLEEAHVLFSQSRPFKDRSYWKKVIDSVSHVKVLSVNSWFLQFPFQDEDDLGSFPPMAENLDQLHWWAVTKRSNGALWCDEPFGEADCFALVSCMRLFPSVNHFTLHCDYNMDDENERNTQRCILILGYLSNSFGWGPVRGYVNKNHDEKCAQTDPLFELKDVRYLLSHLKVIGNASLELVLSSQLPESGRMDPDLMLMDGRPLFEFQHLQKDEAARQTVKPLDDARHRLDLKEVGDCDWTGSMV